jgi:hypothetical protein
MVEPGGRGDAGGAACPMLGGSGAAWPPPAGLSPRQVGERMRAHLRALHEQLGRMATATEPEERRRLLQEHWRTLYREMQDVRGTGLVWRGMGGPAGGAPAQGAAAPLPDPDSPGAKLVSRYCVQCHTAPAPALLTGAQWGRVVSRMHVRIEGRVTPIETPSEQEMKVILAYMKEHAR